MDSIPAALLFLQLATGAPMPQDTPRPYDPWIAEDKLQHLGMSAAITTFSYGSARAAGFDRGPALTVSIVAAATAGIAKEIYDRKAGRPFSFKDLFWDALGTAAAVMMLESVR